MQEVKEKEEAQMTVAVMKVGFERYATTAAAATFITTATAIDTACRLALNAIEPSLASLTELNHL